MELRQLKYFLKTAETLNFSEAARVLCITQSTLSQQIKQLEDEFNVRLFERSSHGVTLTESGEELYPYAENAIHSAETCSQLIEDLKNLSTGSLSIGVTYSFSPILTETLFQFIRKFPRVKLNIHYSPMEELMVKLQHHEVDFVLAFKPHGRRFADIESHTLFKNHLSVIVSDNHPLAQRPIISLKELQNYDLALPAKGMQARNAFEWLIKDSQLEFKANVELNSVNILFQLIRQGTMATVLSEAIIYGEIGLKSIPIDVPGNENTMEACVHVLRNRYIKTSARTFITMLCNTDSVKLRAMDWIS